MEGLEPGCQNHFQRKSSANVRVRSLAFSSAVRGVMDWVSRPRRALRIHDGRVRSHVYEISIEPIINIWLTFLTIMHGNCSGP